MARSTHYSENLDILTKEELIKLTRALARGLQQAYYEAAEIGADWDDDLPAAQRARILAIEHHALEVLQSYGFATKGRKDMVLPKKVRSRERARSQ